MDFKEEIKSRIEMTDVCQKYGIEINSSGFARCPFHNEKTASMKIYKGVKGWHCFGCGVGGDIFEFVSKLFNLSFKDTLTKINEDFCLGLPIGKPLTSEERNRINVERMEKEKKRKADEIMRDRIKTVLDALTNEYRRLFHNREKYSPKNTGGQLLPLYLEAVGKIDLIEYKIEETERSLKNGKYEYDSVNT